MSNRPARLRPGVRKAVLVLHLLGVGAWLGIEVVVGIMAAVGAGSGDAADRGLALQVIGTYLAGPMLAAGLIVLVTGLVLGWGSKWGLVRFWWVAVKLVEVSPPKFGIRHVTAKSRAGRMSWILTGVLHHLAFRRRPSMRG